MNVSTPVQPVRVAALYRFVRLEHYESLRSLLAAFCCGRGIKGTLLLAREGINGTVAGSEDAIAELVAHLEAMPEFAGLDVKYSAAGEMPFHRMKVRLKKEIVTMGVPDVDPLTDVGAYVDPGDWNALVDDPDTVLIDTRNGFEVGYGSFAGAVDPETKSFGDFPDWWRANADRFAGKRIAMFCTGGIRCEKSTAFLRHEGVEEVVHLKGGILAYLEQVPEADSRWHGSCFVFDERVSVGHGLVEVGEKD